MRKKQKAGVPTTGLCCDLVAMPELQQQQQQQGHSEQLPPDAAGDVVQDYEIAGLWHEKDQDCVPEHLVHKALKEENKILRKQNKELAKQLLDVQTQLCCVRIQLEYMHYVVQQTSVTMHQHAEH